MTKKSFAIVGAGIGGLTTAIALQRKGFSVNVYENAPEVKPIGAGLTLAGNAVKALTEIGIGDSVLREGKVMKSIFIKNAKGSILATTHADKLTAKYGMVNNFAIHRKDLHRILSSHLPAASIHLGKTCIDLAQDSDGVSLTFADGSEARADYLVACDGIHSAVRKKLIPNAQPRYAGYTCWRAVIDQVPANVDLDKTVEYWGRGSRFGIVPLTGSRVYWFACLNAPRNDAAMKKFSIIDLLFHFGTYASPVPEVLKATRNDQLIWGDIIDLEPIEKYSFNKIVLVGDAAHATTPNLGQGACMAIEDAAVLANCLTHSTSVEQGFIDFEKKRIQRATRIVNTSRKVGEIAQWQNGLAVALRNLGVRLTPDSVAEKQVEFLMSVSLN